MIALYVEAGGKKGGPSTVGSGLWAVGCGQEKANLPSCRLPTAHFPSYQLPGFL
jgi:hypothetical protein